MMKRILAPALLLFGLAGVALPANPAEFKVKVDQVRALLKPNKLSTLLIARPQNFAWLTGGGDNSALAEAASGSGALVVTQRDVYVIGTADRVKRLLEQELRGLNVRSMAYYWYEEFENNEPLRLTPKLAPGRVGSDVGLPGTELMEEALRALRMTLGRDEIKRYRTLGRLAAEACEAAARGAAPGQTEEEIAGVAARELWGRGLTPVAISVAADENAEKYREPLVTTRVLKRLLRVSLSARQGGLIATVSRTVYVGDLPGDLRERQQLAEKMFAGCLNSLAPGVKLQELYAAAIQFYRGLKLTDEWRVAPLGGATGYREREFVITPSTPEIARENQAFVFAPTLEGVRVEDTVLATAAGAEVLTTTGQWPVREVELAGKKFQIPTILVKKP